MRPLVPFPGVQVSVNGTGLDGMALAALASVRVARRLSLPAQCELGFALAGGAGAGFELARGLGVGCRLDVAVAGDRDLLFSGDLTAYEWVHGPDGSAELRVRAYDELHRLRKRQQVIGRTEITVVDLAEELAGHAGLRVDTTATGPRWPVLVQHRQSDLELLQEVAERAGLWFAVADGALRLFTLEGVDDTIGLALHDTLLAARFDATAEPACRSVSAHGWDPVAAGVLAGGAGDARVRRTVAADVAPGTVGAPGERVLVDHHGPNADHLDAAAQAELDRRVAREVTFTGTAEGDARLRPGRRVRVTGAAPDVEGTYVLTETTHTLDASGYLVQLSTVPPPSRPADGAAVATLGRVTSADDPEGLGRVRVLLPGYGGVETDWREVVTAGAGGGKGLVALPDVDDRVLLLLPHGDPAAAVVVGGLFGDRAPIEAAVAGGAVRRWSMRTPAGQRVLLDDEVGSVAVANADGSSVVLGTDRVTVHAATDLVVEAPGHTMTLRADRIEMVQASTPEDGPLPALELPSGGNA